MQSDKHKLKYREWQIVQKAYNDLIAFIIKQKINIDDHFGIDLKDVDVEEFKFEL